MKNFFQQQLLLILLFFLVFSLTVYPQLRLSHQEAKKRDLIKRETAQKILSAVYLFWVNEKQLPSGLQIGIKPKPVDEELIKVLKKYLPQEDIVIVSKNKPQYSIEVNDYSIVTVKALNPETKEEISFSR